MSIYRIYYHSSCGTYFASYLQSVTVVADSKAEAIELTQLWLKEQGRCFLEMDPKKWGIEFLGDAAKGVVDYHVDSDY